ncbi:MAG: 50S ribosomal protein L17 [bacterium]
MRHQVRGKKLGRKKHVRVQLMKNLAISIIMEEKVKTTITKAKMVRGLVDKAIILGKDEKLASKQKLQQLITNKKAEAKLRKELKEKYKEKVSGFTRITKIGKRLGDAAEMVIIELV